MIRSRSRKAESGMTLVEVLVALVIVAVALTGLVGTHSALSLSRIRYADVTQAAWLAQSKFVAWELEGYQEFEREQDGDFGEDYPDWVWLATLEPVETGELHGLMKIELIIENTETGLKQRFISYHEGEEGLLFEMTGFDQ